MCVISTISKAYCFIWDFRIMQLSITLNLDENDNAQYERVSQMYISKNTREGYQSCMKILLLFLDDDNPECVSEYAKRALQDAFTSGATVKQNNKAIISRALQLIKSANSTSQPVYLQELVLQENTCRR